MDSFKKKSGAQNKKIRRDRKAKEEKLLQSIPKIGSLFSCAKTVAQDSEEATSSSKVIPAATIHSENNDSTDVCLGPCLNDNDIELVCHEDANAVRKESEVVVCDPELKTIGIPGIHSESLKCCPAELVNTAPSTAKFQRSDTQTMGMDLDIGPSAGASKRNSHDQEDVFSNDPGDWTHPISKSLIDYFITNPPLQDIANCDFSKSVREYSSQKRYATKEFFLRKLPNGEVKSRDWLIYSNKNGSVYCIPCMLFNSNPNTFGIGEHRESKGFNDWKNALKRLAEHEQSAEHRKSVESLVYRSTMLGRVDTELCKQLETEKNYWRNILKRIVATITFLGTRGLPFRGDDEIIGSVHNGNYLGALEYLAKFDVFIAEHIAKYGNQGSGNTSYLSSTICNEFIELIGKRIVSILVSELKNAKYFAIIVDSTPDVSHVDQLTFVLRYVQVNGSPVERFIKFIPMASHKAEYTAELVLNTLSEYDIPINDCRGQSYDNASNMSGKYTGLQARIRDAQSDGFKHAEFVPCAGHSLNLVGSCAAEVCSSAIKFFFFLQKLYNFFSASTHRWTIMKNHLPKECKVVKSLSETRWSARADASEALHKGYHGIKSALIELHADTSQNPITREEASSLRKKLDLLETALMAVYWDAIMARFRSTSESLQKVELDLGMVVSLYQSLEEYVKSLRECFQKFEDEAKLLSGNETYAVDGKRRIKRKRQNDELPGDDEIITGRTSMRADLYVILDKLTSELSRRKAAYSNLYDKFGFLTQLKEMTHSEIDEHAQNLISKYSTDLDDGLALECLHFRSLVPAPSLNAKGELTQVTALDLLKMIKTSNLGSTFPNIEIALGIFITIPAANCSGERSFSTLSRVQNHLRSTMSEHRLSALSIMAIESKVLSTMDTDRIIDEFAAKKSRRKSM